jgi:hypothetical protein
MHLRVSALGDATAVSHTRLVLEKSAWPDRQAHAHYSHKADQSFQRKRYFKRTSIFLVLGQSTANTKLGEGGAVAQLIPAFDGDVSATSTLCSVGSCRGLVRLMRWLEAAIDEMVFVLHNHTLPARNVLRSGRFTFLIQKHLYFHGIKYRTKLLFLFYVPPFSFGNMVVRLWTK